MVLRRRPLFYVFNMIFPCLLITLVAFLGFYLPPGSSEKVNMGITTLLSITVFLMLSIRTFIENLLIKIKFNHFLVTESMPQTSEQLPLLGIYYAVTNVIVSLSTAMSVFTLHINNKGLRGQEVPKLLKKMFFKYIARFLRIKLESVTSRKLLNDRLMLRIF